MIGLLREDAPWLYELGLELHRAIQRGAVAQIKKAGKDLHLALDFTARGPFTRDLLKDKESFYFLRESLDLLHHYVEQSIDRAVDKAAKQKASTKRRRQASN